MTWIAAKCSSAIMAKKSLLIGSMMECMIAKIALMKITRYKCSSVMMAKKSQLIMSMMEKMIVTTAQMSLTMTALKGNQMTNLQLLKSCL